MASTDRHTTRPDHAFRAGIQAFIRREGVDDAVIDALVGHHGNSTRDRQYARPDELMEPMRQAVALLPDVDWKRKVAAVTEAGTGLA